jgi:hypothetical protein
MNVSSAGVPVLVFKPPPIPDELHSQSKLSRVRRHPSGREWDGGMFAKRIRILPQAPRGDDSTIRTANLTKWHRDFGSSLVVIVEATAAAPPARRRESGCAAPFCPISAPL